MPSSPIRALVNQLTALDLRQVPCSQQVLAALGSVPEPRKCRGIRHPMIGILLIAVCAVAAGTRSFAAMAKWAGDTAAGMPAELEIGASHAAMIGRVLTNLDPDALNTALARWAQAQKSPAVVAVDGKEVRGAKNGGGSTVHLLAALDHDSAAVVAQVEVGVKTNEIPRFPVLLNEIKDLTEVVVTADALHAQRTHAQYLAGRGTHYLVTVKGNQPLLHRQLRSLPWGQVPIGHRHQERVRGRSTIHTTKAVSVHTGIDFPHAAQVIHITRRIGPVAGPRRFSTEVAYAVTSVPSFRAGPATLGAWVRGHWGIKNRLHHVRDMTFTEDASQVRTGTGPRAMASIRNLVLSLHRLAGQTNIAQVTRRTARDPPEHSNSSASPHETRLCNDLGPHWCIFIQVYFSTRARVRQRIPVLTLAGSSS